MTSISSFSVEHRPTPEAGTDLFVGVATPRLSWTVTTDDSDWAQTAYEVRLTVDGRAPQIARIESSEQVLVAWPFAPLASRQRGSVAVASVGASGTATAFSEEISLEATLLEPGDWQAQFISPKTFGGLAGPAPLVFTSVELGGDTGLGGGVVRARLHATALGVHEISINGTRVGDDVLAPGWTAYEKRLRVQTYDVTDLVQSGPNAIQSVLGNGWYRGQLTWDLKRTTYGDRLALLAQLEVTYADGRTQIIGTDGTWQACETGITADDLYDGQSTDLRVPTSPDGKPAEGVDLIERDLTTLVAPQGPPVRAVEVLPAVKLWRSPSGKLLVDFGQNLVGWVRWKVRGAAGQTVTVRHAEVLEHDELGVRPLRKAKATDTYVLTGGDDVAEPSLTFHGFRYAELSGVEDVDAADVEAVVITSDLVRTGWFDSSHAELNQLHANTVWGMRGNFVDVPTDCPQRDERLGWTGDIQVFSPTASYLFDTAGFLGTWLEDLAAEQLPDGSVPFVIPDPDLGPDAPAAAAWGDAATVVPWVLWERFADHELLARQFSSMKAWVDKLVSLSDENGLWVGGFQFGDWLDPTAPPEDAAKAQADPDVVATAHLAHSAQIVADAAAVLGQTEDAARYGALAERTRTAFAAEYVTPSGRVLSDCQTAYGMALVWDLLPEGPQRTRAAARLAELVRKADFRVSTGFVGTPLVLDALSRNGYEQLAGRMLQERGNPSWLYPVTMGATTIWERWDSMLPDGSINPGEMTSFNHYALGAVADWMHRRLAGLAPAAPGWRSVVIDPLPALGLTWVESSHDSPYGHFAVRWEIEDDTFRLTATLPPGTTGTVRLPGQDEPIEIGHGDHAWSVPLPEISTDGLDASTGLTIGDVLPHAPEPIPATAAAASSQES